MDRTTTLLTALRNTVERGEMPPPLQSSYRCDRCSLAGICLPDEVNLLREMEKEKKLPKILESEPEDEKVRMLLPARDDLVPLYVVGQGGRQLGSVASAWRSGLMMRA
jgi:hypothetical protein